MDMEKSDPLERLVFSGFEDKVDVELFEELLRKLSDPDSCDSEYFWRLRRLCLKMGMPMFHDVCKKYVSSVSKLATSFIANAQEVRDEKKIGDMLGFLAFMGFRFSRGESLALLSIVCREIETGSMKNVALAFRMLRFSVETVNSESSDGMGFNLFQMLLPSVSKRLVVWANMFSGIDEDMAAVLMATSSILVAAKPWYSKFMLMIDNILCSFEGMIKYVVPPSMKVSRKVMIDTVKLKLVMALRVMANSNCKQNQRAVAAAEASVGVVMELIKNAAPGFPTFVEAAVIEIQNIRKYEVRDQIPELELIQNLPSIINVGKSEFNVVMPVSKLMQICYEKLNTSGKRQSDGVIIDRYKFLMSLWHSDVPASALATLFQPIRTMMTPVADPQTHYSILMTSLFSLQVCISAHQRRFIERERQGDRGDFQKFSRDLKMIADKILRFERIVSDYVKEVFMFQAGRRTGTLALGLTSCFGMVDMQIVVECVKTIMMFMVRSLVHIQSTYKRVCWLNTDPDPEKHYKLCAEHFNAMDSCMNSQTIHKYMAEETMKLIGTLPYNIAVNVWDLFFREYFTVDDVDSVVRDKVTFQELRKSLGRMRPFLDAALSFIEYRLLARESVDRVVREFGLLFETMSHLVFAFDSSLEFAKQMEELAMRVLSAAKGYFESPLSYEIMMEMIGNLASLMDKVLGSSEFSKCVMGALAELLVDVSMPCLDTAVVKCLVKCAYANDDLLQNTQIIERLFNAIMSDADTVLPVIKRAWKKFRPVLSGHPSIGKFYSAIIHLTTFHELKYKSIAVGFLKHIPVSMYDDLELAPGKSLVRDIVEVCGNGGRMDVEEQVLVEALLCSPWSNVISDLHAQFLEAVCLSGEWDVEHRRNVLKLFTGLFSRAKSGVADVSSIVWSLLARKETNIPLRVCSLIALCYVYEEAAPEYASNMIAMIETESTYVMFIDEIRMMFDLSLVPTRMTGEMAALIMIDGVSGEIVDPIRLALLVHKIACMVPQSVHKVTRPYMRLPGLIFPESVMTLVSYVRILLKGKRCSLAPLLSTLQLTRRVKEVVIMCELMRDCEASAFLTWVEDCFANYQASWCETIRALGFVFSTFPVIMEHKKSDIQNLIYEEVPKLVELPADDVKKVAFVIFITPVIEHGQRICGFNYSLCIEMASALWMHPKASYREQAHRMLRAIVKTSDSRLIARARATVEDLVSHQGFLRDLSPLMWWDFKDVSNTIYMYMDIAPETVCGAIITFLGHIGDDVSRISIPRVPSLVEFNNCISTMFKFLGHQNVVKTFVERQLALKLITVIAKLFTVCTMMRTLYLRSLVTCIIRELPEAFIEYMNTFLSCVPAENHDFLLWVFQEDSVKEMVKQRNQTIKFGIEEAANGVAVSGDHVIRVLLMHMSGIDISELMRVTLERCILAFDVDIRTFHPIQFLKLSRAIADIDMAAFLSMTFFVVAPKFHVLATIMREVFLEVTKCRKLSPDIFRQIRYQGTDETRRTFFKTFATTLLKEQPESVPEVLSIVRKTQKINVYVGFLIALCDSGVTFDEAVVELYNAAHTEEAKFSVFLYWQKTGQDASLFSRILQDAGAFIHMHMPQEVQTAFKMLRVPKGVVIPSELIGVLGSFNRTAHTLSIMTHLISEAPEQFGEEARGAIEDQMICLNWYISSDNMVNVLQLIQPFCGICATVPTSVDAIANNTKHLLCHISYFISRCITMFENRDGKLAHLGVGFAGAVQRMIRLFGASWSQCSPLIDIYVREMRQKPSQLVQSFLNVFAVDLVRAAVESTTFEKAEVTLETLAELVPTSMWSGPCLGILYYARSKNWSHLFRQKMSEYCADTNIMLRIWPIVCTFYPSEVYVPRVLSGCVELEPRMDQNVMILENILSDTCLRYIYEYPREGTLDGLLHAFKQCRGKLACPRKRQFVLRALVNGLDNHNLCQRTRDAILSELNNPEVSKLYIEWTPCVASRDVIKEMTPAAQFAAIKSIAKVFPDMLDQLTLYGVPVVHDLAGIFKCSVGHAALLMSMMKSAPYVSPHRATGHVELTLVRGIDMLTTTQPLSEWGECKSVDEEFIIGKCDVISLPMLFMRLGFRERAMEALSGAGTMEMIDFEMLRDIMTENGTIGERGVEIVNENIHNPTRARSELCRFMEAFIPEVNAHNFLDFLILRQLKYSIKMLSEQDVTQASAFRIALNPAESLHRHRTLCRVVSADGAFTSHMKCNANTQILRKITEAEQIRAKSVLLHQGLANVESTKSDLEQMLSAVFSGPVCVAKPALEALVSGLKIDNSNDVFLSAFLKIGAQIKSSPAVFKAVLSVIPFHWSQLFNTFAMENLCYIHLLIATNIAFRIEQEDSPSAAVFHTDSALREFLDLLNDVVETPTGRKLKMCYAAEEEITSQFRNAQYNGRQQPAVDIINESLFVSQYVRPVRAPLVNGESRITQIVAFQTHPDDIYVTINASLEDGRKLVYHFSPATGGCRGFYTLCSVISRLMSQLPECVSRSQRLHVIPSAQLRNGFSLWAPGDYEKVVKKSHLDIMSTLQSDASLRKSLRWTGGGNKHPQKRVDLASKRMLCDWYSLFASRFSALSTVQITAGSPVPNPYDIFVDWTHGNIALTQLEKTPEDRSWIRMCGVLGPLCERHFMYGPFKIGMMTAAQCISANTSAIRLFVTTLISEITTPHELIARADSLSTRISDVDVVQKNVNGLIEASRRHEKDICALPWL